MRYWDGTELNSSVKTATFVVVDGVTTEHHLLTRQGINELPMLTVGNSSLQFHSPGQESMVIFMPRWTLYLIGEGLYI